MEDHSMSQKEYVSKVLSAYRMTPGTTGNVHRPDRLLAAQLHQRRIPLKAIEDAMVLAAARRLFRDDADAVPLDTIRSLAYFSPVIEEVLHQKISQDYFQYLRKHIRPFLPTR